MEVINRFNLSAMYQKISKSDEIMSKLKAEGKVRKLTIEEVSSMNDYMEEIRRDYIRKSKLSEQSASEIWITI